MIYKLVYHKEAEKFIRSNKIVGKRFMRIFEEIVASPQAVFQHDVKKFHTKGLNDCFRLRVGKYRAVFRIIKEELVVFVFDIGSRGDVYKNGAP